jgi:hypothetical protein
MFGNILYILLMLSLIFFIIKGIKDKDIIICLFNIMIAFMISVIYFYTL